MKNYKTQNLTPAERKRRYVEAAKKKELQQREKYRRDKMEGKMGTRYLAFLSDILRTLGLSRTDFARGIGITQQGVQYRFFSDDILLSTIEKGLGYYGYRIEVKLEPNEEIVFKLHGDDSAQSRYRIEGITIPEGSVVYPKYIHQCIDNGGRVAFLAKSIVDSGRMIGALCKEAGIDSSSIRHYLVTQDDIRIRYLYLLAKVMNLRVVWSVVYSPNDVSARSSGYVK